MNSLIDALLHDDAAGRGAALSGSAKGAPQAAFDGEVEVGVIEHNHGIFSAQFERAMFEALGGGGADDPAHGGRSGQRDGADRRVLGQGRPDFGAESGHDVDHAFGYAGIGQRLHQVKGGEGRVLRRFNHAGVAADDGGQQLPRRNRHGKVPGRNHAADADRLAHGHGEFVGQLGRHGGAEHAAAFAGVVIGSVDSFLDVAARFFEDFAHFAGHVAGVLFFALDQDFGGAEDDLGAARGRNQAPLGEGAFGSVHRCVHVGLVRSLEDGDNFAGVGWVAIFEGLSGDGVDPFAVNEVLENASFGRAA